MLKNEILRFKESKTQESVLLATVSLRMGPEEIM